MISSSNTPLKPSHWLLIGLVVAAIVYAIISSASVNDSPKDASYGPGEHQSSGNQLYDHNQPSPQLQGGTSSSASTGASTTNPQNSYSSPNPPESEIPPNPMPCKSTTDMMCLDN